MERLAVLYDAWDKPDKATEWRARLSAADSSTVSERQQKGDWHRAELIKSRLITTRLGACPLFPGVSPIVW